MTKQKLAAMDHSFLGQGWGFPINFNIEEGSVDLIGGVEDIEQSSLISEIKLYLVLISLLSNEG